MLDTLISNLSLTQCCLAFVVAVVITFIAMVIEETK